MNRAIRFIAVAEISAGLASSMCGCGLFGRKPQNQPQKPYQSQLPKFYLAVAIPTAENVIAMPDAGKDDAIVVAVLRDGAVFIANDKVDPVNLSSRIRDMLANRADKHVYVRADARTEFRAVEGTIDSLRAADVDDVGLLVARGKADEQRSYHDFLNNLTGFELFIPPAPIGTHPSTGPLPPKGAVLVQILKCPGATPAYKINHEGVQKSDMLPKLIAIYAHRAERALYIEEDDSLYFASVVEVIDLAMSAGADHVVVLTPQMIAGH